MPGASSSLGLRFNSGRIAFTGRTLVQERLKHPEAELSRAAGAILPKTWAFDAEAFRKRMFLGKRNPYA